MKLQLTPGRGTDNRLPDTPPASAAASAPPSGTFQSHAMGSPLAVQSAGAGPPNFPFQQLPTPAGAAPYHFDLSKLLAAQSIAAITQAGKLVFHVLGDTGDKRGTQMDFVATIMTQDYDASKTGAVPAFCFHVGDVVYFSGDISDYASCFYEPYANYPAAIVSIPGNHDGCPDDPPGPPNKIPLDGWMQNFMSTTPAQLGSPTTSSSRTQMDLPNCYWTFTTPFATIIGLYSNVNENEAEIREPQLTWFANELKNADKQKALIVAIHHPPYSGDQEHAGSLEAEKILFGYFSKTGVYPHMILSGHVHNYQRFTVKDGPGEIACIVIGNGGYKKLGTLREIKNAPPKSPLQLTKTLSLASYDDKNFGFIRFEVSSTQIVGNYYSAPFQVSGTPKAKLMDTFIIELKSRAVQTNSASKNPS